MKNTDLPKIPPAKVFFPEIDLRGWLRDELAVRKTRNKKYSLRAFAKSLGLSHAGLSEMLAGKRRITTQNVNRIARALKWDAATTASAQASVAFDPLNFTQVPQNQVDQLTEWYFNVIMELFLVEGFQEDPAWIAKTVGISESEAFEALQTLVRTGRLARDRRGKLKVMDFKTTTIGNLRSAQVNRRIQKQFLALQSRALEEVPVEDQSSMALTIAMDPADLTEARKIILKAIKDLSKLLNHKGVRRRQVYRLQVGLFPLTRL